MLARDGSDLTRLPAVSVIIPVGDVEAYLGACIDSIIRQDFSDWEMILVLDEPEDGSPAVARRYAAEDDRITVIAESRGGPGRARNVGLDNASGEFVFFVDADDIVPERVLSTLVKAARSDRLDMVSGYGDDFWADGSRNRYWTQSARIFTEGVAVTSVDKTPELLEDHVVWSKLYRREHIEREHLRFPEGVLCEDVYFTIRAVALAQRVRILPLLAYLHRRHDGAISADYLRTKQVVDWLEQSSNVLAWVREHVSAPGVALYFENFVRKQWWTRARGFDRVETREVLNRLEALSAQLHEGLGENVAKLGTWFATTLEFFASSGPSRCWWNENGVLNPLDPDIHSEPARAVEVALRAVGQLDPGVPVERRLGWILLQERALQAVSDRVLDDEESERLVIERVADRIAPFSSELAELHPTERARALVPAAGNPRVKLTTLHVEERGWVLRGIATNARGMDNAVGGELRVPVVGAETVVPVWWGHVESEARRFHWQAVVPRELEISGLRRALEVRFHQQAGWTRWAPLRQGDGADLNRPTTWVRADTSLTAEAPSTPLLERIFTFPLWTSNPYMQMLHLEARASNIRMVGTENVDDVISELKDPTAHGLVHIQWPSPVTEREESSQAAENRVNQFLAALSSAKRRGRPVLWTIHNVLPHDTRFHAAAVRLHQGLADIADRVHVLNAHTPELVAEHYSIDEKKLVVIPHSSYHGVYAARMPRDLARQALGAGEDSIGVLHFGQLRPYKGLQVLIDVMTGLSVARPDLELLVAGKPAAGAWPLLDSLRESGAKATIGGEYVRDEDVAAWFSAADVAVLPYLKVLNSGTMHLAATYGVPVVLPDEPHLRADFGEEAWVRFFDPEDAERTIAALIEEPWYLADEVRESARVFARAKLPVMMARAYLDLVTAMAKNSSVRAAPAARAGGRARKRLLRQR